MRSLILERDSIKRKERVKEILAQKEAEKEGLNNKYSSVIDIFE